MTLLLIVSLTLNLIAIFFMWSMWTAFTDLLSPMYGMLNDLTSPAIDLEMEYGEAGDGVAAQGVSSLPGAAAYETLEDL